ncbi:MAG: CPBP family intramembrane metalloprotease [Bacteroidetes bacterium]|nr:MAG: CPBP family intramembrane metalloprotease [Bacteroidota bacterium]REK34981.1 MAG: CPBP family intramembrane metalloprotease [Bacteroidota bacterium]REK48222.1 MAG: CPBP family intramembrane metalloprotease [Bacteroidota bacterium]
MAHSLKFAPQRYNIMGLRAIWQHNSDYSKFLISVGIILLSAVIFTFISTLFAGMLFGVNMEELQLLVNNLDDPASISVLKLIQTVSSVGTFIIPPIILAYLFYPSIPEYLQLDVQPDNRSSFLVVILLFMAVPLINFLVELNSAMHLPDVLKPIEDWMRSSEDRAAELTKAFLVMHTWQEMAFNLFMIALIPALGEELLFRGVIQKIFTQWTGKKHLAVWLAAFLFSVMHVQFYGFVPRLLLGALMGYLLVWSGSLWLPILAHFVNNAAAVVFSYLYFNHYTSFDADKVGTGATDTYMVAISLAATVFILFRIYSIESKKELLSGE